MAVWFTQSRFAAEAMDCLCCETFFTIKYKDWLSEIQEPISSEDRERRHVRLSHQGQLPHQGIKSTNPIAVGDRVEFEEREVEDCLITSILPRRNYIVRKPANLSKQIHIIAANVDLALIVVTVNHPVTSTVFIDRFWRRVEAYAVPAQIVINKKTFIQLMSWNMPAICRICIIPLVTRVCWCRHLPVRA